MLQFPNELPEEQYKSPESKNFEDDKDKIKLPHDNPGVFEEVQFMDQAWIWALLGIETLVIMVPLILTGQPWWIFLMMSAIMVLTLSMVSSIKLYTRIDDEGVHYRMKPFHFRERTIYWSDIDSIQERKYSPIKEYGGYGIRIGMNGSAYNVRGNHGIQIVKKNGKKILIGTQMSDKVITQLEQRPLIV